MHWVRGRLRASSQGEQTTQEGPKTKAREYAGPDIAEDRPDSRSHNQAQWEKNDQVLCPRA